MIFNKCQIGFDSPLRVGLFCIFELLLRSHHMILCLFKLHTHTRVLDWSVLF